MKGGVGKTTAAVNLSYFAAASGRRTLLWDLDPQAASSFALRVEARVDGFGKASLEGGQALGAAIKETDHHNLHLLPADFAYRKFDRFLSSLGKPKRLVTSLVEAVGRDFDVVFLDCPAGFSLLTEGIFAAADVLLVPTIPTVLSLRTLATVVRWAGRSNSPARLAAFLSMVDRRKTLHRRTCELAGAESEVFLGGQIPYASVVEQMAVRRLPLGVFAARDSATTAFAQIWMELAARIEAEGGEGVKDHESWIPRRRTVERLIARLEPSDDQPSPDSSPVSTGDQQPRRPRLLADSSSGSPRAVALYLARKNDGAGAGDATIIHSFDTEHHDVVESGYVLELHERPGNLVILAAPCRGDGVIDSTGRAQAQIDSSWAVQILSGELSPVEALERRLGQPGPRALEVIRAAVGGRRLRRTGTCVAGSREASAIVPPSERATPGYPNIGGDLNPAHRSEQAAPDQILRAGAR
jgi:cellulose biosynthesis protein BcsQ